MNNGITKQIACQLFAWGYEILEIQSGKKWSIKYIDEERMVCGTKSEHLMHEISFNDIGKHYFIIARSTHKLCEEIDGKVPLVECAKMSYNEEWSDVDNGVVLSKEGSRFYFEDGDFNMEYQWYSYGVRNQQSLFNHLYSLHFAINLPEGTWKEI